MRREGVEIVEHRQMIGERLRVELCYGDHDAGRSSDVFDWQLYTPDELAAEAQAVGLVLRTACTAFDESRPPSADEPRSAEPGRILDLFRTRGLQSREPRVRDIPLGLGSALAAPGDHIAYFWESEREFDATAGFLAAGASLGEACVLIGHDAANERLMAGLERLGLNVRALMQERQLQVASVSASADGLLLELDERIKDAVHRGMPAVRILGTLGWGRGTSGWPPDREILRLEAHVTGAAERLPSIVVCAYDMTNLPGPMLLKGGLECHPLTLRRDCLRHNEHYVSPERFLEEL